LFQEREWRFSVKQRLSGFKVVFFAVAITLAVSAGLNSLGTVPLRQPSSGKLVSGTYVNPLQVALLYWYPANKITTFAVGAEPQGIAFDGTDIWVANFDSSNVTELQASTGKLLGTFAAGTNPEGVAFDGANVWVANYGSNKVTKLRASDGTVLGAFAAGTNPWGVAFDG
jgi:DNA-binding beta-propeller fold protein YncE